MLKSFRKGGVHPPENKISASSSIEVFPIPELVTIPLSQHIGAPAKSIVNKGDHVKTGQLIAESSGFISARIHSSVTGTVVSVDNVPDSGGIRRPAVVIRTENDEWCEPIDKENGFTGKYTADPKEILTLIEDAGIVGMGGATFPTHVKLSVPSGKKVDTLIINGAECEPYLTADHCLMLERGQELIEGISLLARVLGVKLSYVGIENNKADAIKNLQKIANAYPGINIIPLKVKYPQGGEKQLIAAITGREVPSGRLPLDVGVVVQNIGTAVAVYEAVKKRKPLIERIVTVTGKGVKKPKNLQVRIGTPISALIEFCGGIPESTGKIIGGGPMMGKPVINPDSPVTKGTSGILLMETNESKRKAPQACIKCAKCIEVCPMGLQPYMLYKLGVRNMFPEMEGFNATDCIECGCCSYTCPAFLPLLDYIRLGKSEVIKIKRERKA